VADETAYRSAMATTRPALENLKLHGADRSSAFATEPVRLLPCARRIRAVFAGRTVADSTNVLYVFETGHLPVYYFPLADVDQELLERTDRPSHCPRKGDASYWSVRVGDAVAENAAWGYEQPFDAVSGLEGHVALYWREMDHWYEEDDEVFVHARDPYNRVDVLHGSRQVRVEIDGVVLAETSRPSLLFETGLPTRYYIPRADVRLDRLEPSSTTSACPYKGEADYYSAQVGDRLVPDIAWTYLRPIPEQPKLEQLIAFFDEKVDTWVDGVRQERPVSAWS
jgi:uncharacterized protein (DUF427 family)